MDVPAEKLSLLKVGELARRTGKTARAIHLYEELGLLTPAVRSKGGFRLYSPAGGGPASSGSRSCRTWASP